jgi:hypothetical protein
MKLVSRSAILITDAFLLLVSLALLRDRIRRDQP